MNGVLIIDKPAGMTSHDVVGRIRRVAKTKRVGHAGTLDPDAVGVLVVCIGSATRLAEYITGEDKEYSAELILGTTTSTEDASGEVLAVVDASHISRESAVAVLSKFRGDIQQTPPMVSAVHHQGRRLYEIAREGGTVDREARTVHIASVELTAFECGPRPVGKLEVVCSKGTYIRTLCADIGAALGVGGHMGHLCRTRVGSFKCQNAVPLDSLTSENVTTYLLPSVDALGSVPIHPLSGDDYAAILNGKSIITSLADCELAAAQDSHGELIALSRVMDGVLRPFKVFPPSPS